MADHRQQARDNPSRVFRADFGKADEVARSQVIPERGECLLDLVVIQLVVAEARDRLVAIAHDAAFELS
jgi:hypothetical protein